MSVGEHGDDYPVTLGPMPEAVREFDRRQKDLFASIADCTSGPVSEETAAAFNKNSELATDAFREVVAAIASDDELSVQERSRSIATWYFEAHNSHLDFFREIVPDGSYEQGDSDYDEIVENVSDLFAAELDVEDIANQVADNYVLSLSADMDDLLDAANPEPSRKTKAIYVAKDIGERTLEISKIAAGVAIGTILARQAMKRFKP